MGRPPRVEASEVCRVIALHPEPIVTAADVHETLDMTRAGARKRMDRLVEDGYLESKTIGAAGKVYWLTDAGRRKLNDAF